MNKPEELKLVFIHFILFCFVILGGIIHASLSRGDVDLGGTKSLSSSGCLDALSCLNLARVHLSLSSVLVEAITSSGALLGLGGRDSRLEMFVSSVPIEPVPVPRTEDKLDVASFQGISQLSCQTLLAPSLAFSAASLAVHDMGQILDSTFHDQS